MLCGVWPCVGVGGEVWGARVVRWLRTGGFGGWRGE